MAGKKDIVEQALKLIAGGAKEAGPSAAERAAKNLDVFNTAKRLGEDTNDIAKLQETKRLMDYHKGLMGDVRERAQSLAEIQRQMQEQGVFPMEVGTRFTTPQSKKFGQPPHVVTGYYVDPKNPSGRYGYRVRQEHGDGNVTEQMLMIRDPKLEALHGPEKWEELQRGFVPMTGPKVVKAVGGSIREGYAGKGRVVGDIVDQALKLVTGGSEEAAKTGIRAYHGSPHDFDRFDMSKIGTGEGAQAYGHGLYFAESEPVATGYRRSLAGPESMGTVTFDGRPIVSGGSPAEGWNDPNLILGGNVHARDLAETMLRHNGNVDAAVSELRERSQSGLERAQAIKNEKLRQMAIDSAKTTSDMADLLQANPNRYGVKVPGHTYEVNIAADPNAFLDWDKPLSEQPGFLKSLVNYDPDYNVDYEERLGKVFQSLQPVSEPLGQDFYAELARGNKKGAAAMLKNLGVPGIKYLDAGSRSAGEGTRNYVVFDDKLISIIRKYGIAGASAMLGYNLMENLDANQAQAATVADEEYQATQPEVRGGMLPPGMEPSGEMTSRTPSASERIYDYVRSVLGGDEATKGQRAETVMNIIDQTPLAAGPMAYDIGRGIAEKVAYADGGFVGESYDPDAEAAIALARREVQGPFPPSSPQPELPSDGTYVERRPSKIERTFDILSPYVTEPVMAGKRIMTTSPHILMGYGTPEETEAAIGDALTVVSTMGGASSVVPKPANSIGVFGGVRSRTADKNALTKAQIMESQGATSGDIWRETGWERGAEGQWRYEIPDIGSTVDPSKMQIDLSSTSMTTPKTAKLYDYLNHPEFFAAYPEMKNMEVRLQPGTVLGNDYVGYYMPRQDNAGFIVEPHIGLNSNELKDLDAQRSTLLHEIQHAIQQKEGFMRGANKEMFSPNTVPNPKVKIYEDAIRNDAELKEYTSMLKSKEFQKETDEAHEIYMRDVAPVLQELRDKEAKYGVDLGDEWREIFRNHYAKIKEMFPLLKRRDDLFQSLEDRGIPFVRPRSEYLTPGQAYEMTAGEVEARNVQKRRDIEREVLRGKPPETTESFPRNQQLIDWNDTSWRKGYADGGEVDDDITDALRIAKQDGGVLMEDAKGNKYDAQGNLIPPTAPGPNPARTDAPQAVAQRAVVDPATYDALMEYYAVPDRDIMDYEATKAAVAAQPRETQQMTHVGAKPRREVTVDMPLFGGEYSMGTAPYDVASGMSGVAQTAYDLKTAPFYAIPFTAPIAAGMDVAEGLATNDPLTASLAIGFGPGSKYAKAAGIGAVNYFMDPAEAEAGPARWFSKAVEAARNIPMNKMTGEQALAMLRKGVSPEELKWIGADRFLPGEESITKQDLIDYLEKNRVGTKDVVFADRSQKYPYKSAEGWQNAISRAERAGNFDEAERLTLAWEEYEGVGGFETPRYKRHSTFGGDDYRETLITLPTSEYGRLFQSGHWEGYPNVIGHIRTQILDVNPPGSNRPYKAFNVDEAQSDYAKEGREIGFSSPELIKKIEDEIRSVQKEREKYQLDLRAEGEKIAALDWEASKQAGSLPPVSDRFARQQWLDDKRAILNNNPDYLEAYSKHKELQQKNDELIRKELELSRNNKGVPYAPYVTNTQNWTDLSIKKALDQAIDAGADYFTYTPGEAQAARYSLRNAVDELHYSPSDSKLYGKKNGRWIFEKKVEPDKLPKYVGSAVSEELLKQPPQVSKWYATPRHVLSGQQLELGGEGMIDYYNNIYKKRVEKVIKDATGKKVQWEVIPVQTADGPREQLGFRLTDDFQNARFSDFNKGGRVTGRGKYADSDTVGRALALTSEV